jgi:hypothetical protein
MTLVVVVSAALVAGLFFAGATDEPARSIQRMAALLIPAGVLAFSIFWSAQLGAELRNEERRVAALEDARRRGDSGWLRLAISDMLGRSMMSPLNRVRALEVYVHLLSDSGRFEEASETVEGMLADGVPLTMVAPLRAARVYAMLRDQRLVDADRALSELRRTDPDVELSRQGEALVVLLQLYRDAVTGHGEEALRLLDAKRGVVARQLGVRVAEADALGAHAALSVGRPDEAALLWSRATLLLTPQALLARYPQLQSTSSQLPAAPTPVELQPTTAVQTTFAPMPWAGVSA